ncbi:MAG: glycosyltransferase family 2 protein [Bacteroidetes bacterium]|nr:glycosyltransferase family 2 protein [Bacteroidota bacterium]
MPQIALITVLYHADLVLEDFISGISHQDFKDYKLYLVDNSFNSESTQLIQNLIQRYPITDYLHINSGGNIGVAAGNNLGLYQAQADGCRCIIFLNNDITISQSFMLGKIYELCQSHKMVTPKIYYHNTDLIWMAGGYIDLFKAIGVHYGMNQKDSQAINQSKYVTYAPTCFLAVDMSVIREIGVMDELYFAYYDDTDFVHRAVKVGFRVWYESSLIIYHKVSTSSGGDDSLFYIYYGNRNKIIFIRKFFKGLHKWYLFAYYFLTRFFLYYLRFDKQRKKQLIKATRDGLSIKL